MVTRTGLIVLVCAVAAAGCDTGTDPDPRFAPTRDVALAVGTEHTCALDADGVAYCWGGNTAGQLGTGDVLARSQPTPVAGNHRFVAISAGGITTCGLTGGEGAAYCWGGNADGQVGDGTRANRLQPQRVAGSTAFEEISVGFRFTCARTSGGQVYCWGANDRWQTGDFRDAPALTPSPVAGGLSFRSVTAGLIQACGVTTTGDAYCWGGGQFGALGNGTDINQPQPTPVSGGLRFSSLTTGASTTCGVTTGGETYCWGFDHYGSLGTGVTQGQPLRLEPARISSDPGLATVAPARENSVFGPTCGLTSGGNAYCWGSNAYGVLGSTAPSEQCGPAGGGGGTFTCTGVPVAVEGGLQFSVIRPAGEFVCGITTDRRLYCWGNNHVGQLGSPSTETCDAVSTPRPCTTLPAPVGASFTLP